MHGQQNIKIHNYYFILYSSAYIQIVKKKKHAALADKEAEVSKWNTNDFKPIILPAIDSNFQY